MHLEVIAQPRHGADYRTLAGLREDSTSATIVMQ
jgi:hypothetical protein